LFLFQNKKPFFIYLSKYITIKDFDEDWNHPKFKIGAVEPSCLVNWCCFKAFRSYVRQNEILKTIVRAKSLPDVNYTGRIIKIVGTAI
jgi:hypothetical protein